MQPLTLESKASAQLTRDLLSAQLSNGAWPVYPQRPADTESTAFTSLALILSSRQREQHSPAAAEAGAKRGLSWLQTRQQADGGWPLSDQVPGSTWTTASAVLAFALLDQNAQQVRRGAAWLVSRKGTGYPLIARLIHRVTGAEDPREVNELDPNIPGWPWTDSTFSWVEPTAAAVLALRAALGRSAVTEADAANRRVTQAFRWFLDRMVPGGGWNYGNKRVLGQDIEPYPDTTAWALLALRAAAAREAMTGSLARLSALLETNTSALPRALAVLVGRAYGQDTRALTHALASQCAGDSPDTQPADTRTRALALLALAGPPLPLHVT